MPEGNILAKPGKINRKRGVNKPGDKKFEDYNLPSWVSHPLKVELKPVAILFPGELNHVIGMVRNARRLPAVAKILAEASAVYRFDIEDMMLHGPRNEMARTVFNQPLMFVANLAAYEVLRSRQPDIVDRPQVIAGFSVGEYSALVAAGVITFEEGLKIVGTRARAVQEVVDSVEMLVVMILGYSQEKVETLCRTASNFDVEGSAKADEVVIARHWCPDGFVCAGSKRAVLKFKELVDAERRAPLDCRVMNDHAAHTPIMAKAAGKVNLLLDDIAACMRPPRCELYMNRSGERMRPGTSPDKILKNMREQLVNPVLWESSINNMVKWGVKRFFECGPSKNIKFMLSNFEFLHEAPYEVFKPHTVTESIIV